MTSKRTISLAAGLYDSTIALATGQVAPEGMVVEFSPATPAVLFRTQAERPTFDVAEFSLSAYMVMMAAGDDRHVGLPLFPVRAFRHRDIYLHAGAGIQTPADLAGKVIGSISYDQTAAVWIRGILAEHYDVDLRDCTWVFGRLNETTGHQPRIPLQLPASLQCHWLDDGDSLDAMLAQGRIDAYIGATRPRSFGRGGIVRLFDEYWQEEERYYRKTRVFPIMHTVVMKRSLYEECPGIAENICAAFQQSRRFGRELLDRSGTPFCELPWLARHIEHRNELFGGSPYEDGVEANSGALDTLLRYQFEQGLIRDRPAMEALFPTPLVANHN